jgi:hypothetical protein
MITSECTCEDCKLYNAVPKAVGITQIGKPRKPEHVPGQFKWKPMLAADKYWTYLVTCKVCKWEKFSDYYNAIEWMWWHHADECTKPARKWNR